MAVDCLPAHPEYKQASADKSWLVEERRAALTALEKVSAALDVECGGPGPKAAKDEPPAPPLAVPGSSADAAETDLKRRLRMLRGGEEGASATRLLVTSPGPMGDEEEEEDDDAPPVMQPPEPSAPPPLDDGPALDDSHNPAAAIDFDTAFKALRVSGEEGKAREVRYYPALPAPPPPPVAAAAKEQQVVGDRFAGRGQLRPLVLASGLIGKFLEIAEPNSRKVPM